MRLDTASRRLDGEDTIEGFEWGMSSDVGEEWTADFERSVCRV